MSNPEENPTWDKNFQSELKCIVTDSITHAISDLTSKIDDLINTNKFLEHSLESTATLAAEANRSIKIRQTKVDQQEQIILQQSKQISDAEAYSKVYNLKIFNIPESINETRDTLLQNVYETCYEMDVDISQLYIDNIHRLPIDGTDPCPVIVKFVSEMDKNYVWDHRFILKQKVLK